MTAPIDHRPDPKLDLVFERTVDVPRELVWKAWTMPQHLKKWFTPSPWQTVECEIDLRPGGIFRTVMRSPEGQDHPNLGCYLEIVPNEKLVWTNILLPGYRPAVVAAGCPGETFGFVAVISLQPHGAGTRYTALVLHADEDGRRRHEQMGFQDGWGKAFDQLVALAKTM
jgi:uncharacterized protein YndB with AHSA1/START domain